MKESELDKAAPVDNNNPTDSDSSSDDSCDN